MKNLYHPYAMKEDDSSKKNKKKEDEHHVQVRPIALDPISMVKFLYLCMPLVIYIYSNICER